jgi:hypothetical protein
MRLLHASPAPPYSATLADRQRWARQLMELASRVAINRTVAGVHFPVDSACGAVLGLTLGQYFVNRCTAVPNYDAYAFNGPAFPGLGVWPNDGDFHWSVFFGIAGLNQTPTGYAPFSGAQAGALPPANDLILQWLWDQALLEWS